MKRRVARVVDYLSLVLVGWMGLAFVPVEWVWFDPEDYFVSNGTKDSVPIVTFDRVIKREVKMTYHVSIRSLGAGGVSGRVVCDPTNGPFTYRPTAELPEEIDLVWWTGGDDRCWPQEPGTYTSETCWTVVSPFWGLVPPKTTCRRSNTFTISAVTPQEAEQVIKRQQEIESQVQGLQRGLKQLQRD
jgi:hypothetical protein